MSLKLSDNAASLCWRCRYWDWAIQVTAQGWDVEWSNICNHPVEYMPGDNIKQCAGFIKGE